jgi:hypothetical protein
MAKELMAVSASMIAASASTTQTIPTHGAQLPSGSTTICPSTVR